MGITQNNPGRVGLNRSYPFPVGSGGWNAFDPLSKMPSSDAIVMDNFFPNQGSTDLRSGFESWGTGLGGAVESLYEWSGQTSKKLIAAANNKLWDVTLKAAGTQLAMGYGSNRWQAVNFRGRLILCNGVDAPQDFDGTTITAPAWTGVTLTNLVNVNVFRNRVYFVEKDTANVWYGGVDSVAGALTKFDLSGAGSYGGSLMVMATWTQGTQTGSNEFAVFVMDTGEALIYSGANPGSADWSIIGRFKLGRPLGRRSAFKVGSQLLLITDTGVEDFSTVLNVAIENIGTAITTKISNAYIRNIAVYGNIFGWEGIYYPKGTRLIINVPRVVNTTQDQFVANTASKAWCRFIGQNANCWSLLNGDLYFGGNDGVVYHADYGYSDNNANIEGYLKTAFSYLGGEKSKRKKLNFIRPVILSDTTISPALGISVDFSPDDGVSGTSTIGLAGGTLWDTKAWDTFPWGDSFIVNARWYNIRGLCYCAAVKFKIATNSVSVSIQTMDILYQQGTFI
jgi:hypothetical protein